MSDQEATEPTAAATDPPKAHLPIETREAKVADVDVEQRLIEVITVPYDKEAVVEYRGEIWKESFAPGAFAGIETRSRPVKAILHHDKTRIVGMSERHDPNRPEGLVSTIRIAEGTKDGNETLALAKGGYLDVSAGFAVPGSGQSFDKMQRSRRVTKAFLDHIAFVTDGAYEDAKVLSVRQKQEQAANMEPLVTPLLDEVLAWREAWHQRRSS